MDDKFQNVNLYIEFFYHVKIFYRNFRTMTRRAAKCACSNECSDQSFENYCLEIFFPSLWFFLLGVIKGSEVKM